MLLQQASHTPSFGGFGLRHSGAIARLEATGNPKALQDQLRHFSARMTLRYMKTLPAKRSLEISQGVDLSL